jgi:hypothetical protein
MIMKSINLALGLLLGMQAYPLVAHAQNLTDYFLGAFLLLLAAFNVNIWLSQWLVHTIAFTSFCEEKKEEIRNA